MGCYRVIVLYVFGIHINAHGFVMIQVYMHNQVDYGLNKYKTEINNVLCQKEFETQVASIMPLEVTAYMEEVVYFSKVPSYSTRTFHVPRVAVNLVVRDKNIEQA